MKSTDNKKEKNLMLKGDDANANKSIREKIYSILGEESGIDIHVHKGFVRLTGVVDTKESLDFIESAVLKVEGVEDVQNDLTVKIIQ